MPFGIIPIFPPPYFRRCPRALHPRHPRLSQLSNLRLATTPNLITIQPMQHPFSYAGLLTARQFAKLAKTSGVTKMNLARVRRILVDGKSTQQVADIEGISKTTLYPSLNKVCRQPNAEKIRANVNMVSVTRFPGSMTARQFNRAARRTRLYAESVARARRVLVDGESAQDVADEDGLTREAIYRVIRIIGE